MDKCRLFDVTAGGTYSYRCALGCLKGDDYTGKL